MASLAGSTAKRARDDRARTSAERARGQVAETQVERLHERLAEAAVDAAMPTLLAACRRALTLAEAGGGTDDADRLAAACYAADVLVELAAEGALDADDTKVAAMAFASVSGQPLETASLSLYLHTATNPALHELPPAVALRIVLDLLSHLGVVSILTLWRRVPAGARCLYAAGTEQVSRRLRAVAKAELRGRTTLSLVTSSTLRAQPVLRFGQRHGVLVARVDPAEARIDGYLDVAARALAPILEHEYVLERDADRERIVTAAGEKRLTRIGFDLHDGPVQDVLALAGEVRELRDQIYPFIDDAHRELAYGRFDDLLARTADLDRQLRAMSHSLESSSVVTRPLSETLHRMVEAFGESSGIVSALAIEGDPDVLSGAQRITVFRTVQESLANVREHSGASRVDVVIRARRHYIEVSIADDGQGFDVPRALAQAAQRGRLGLVGIGERVRMLGGSFAIDSGPGGPTTLRFTLPRWEQLGPQ